MINVREKCEVAWAFNLFSKTCYSGTVMREGAEKASVEQYIGKYQNNIANFRKYWTYNETGKLPEIKKNVAIFEK